jgi:hypothetical protein
MATTGVSRLSRRSYFWILMLLSEGGQHGETRISAGVPAPGVLDLVAAGRRVSEVSSDLGISEQTIYTWRTRTHEPISRIARADRRPERATNAACVRLVPSHAV